MRTPMMILSAALLIAPIATEAKAPQPSLEAMKARWGRLEEECRGGQHSPDDATCRARDNAMIALEKRGVCWSYSDWRVYPTDYRWHPCSEARPRGFRPDPALGN